MPAFIEFKAFKKLRDGLLDDDEYRELQNAIINQETRIDPIPDTGGLMKARWKAKGKGKRGGIRVIYFYMFDADTYLMLLVYEKSDTDDLTEDQKRRLKALVEQELKRG